MEREARENVRQFFLLTNAGNNANVLIELPCSNIPSTCRFVNKTNSRLEALLNGHAKIRCLEKLIAPREYDPKI
jgi:hypothetical protein